MSDNQHKPNRRPQTWSNNSGSASRIKRLRPSAAQCEADSSSSSRPQQGDQGSLPLPCSKKNGWRRTQKRQTYGASRGNPEGQTNGRRQGRGGQVSSTTFQEFDRHRQGNSPEKHVEDTNIKKGGKSNVLLWNSPAPYVPLQVEESMVDVLVKWKKTERGMMKDQPAFRLDQIKRMCRQNDWEISLPQALSLRRHHIKQLHVYKSMPQLGLGSQDNIRESARLFEQAVEEYLVHRGVQFWTEAQQKNEFNNHAKPGDVLRCTPDFLLPHGSSIRVQKIRMNSGKRNGGREVVEEKVIHWIEAKMFYGASTIPHGSKGAVGCLMAAAQKYVTAFGPGAMIFMYGCGDRLAADLARVGVLVLDCSDSVPLDIVQDHQRTWCANQDGEILP